MRNKILLALNLLVSRRFFCLFGWHKWNFGSTIIEVVKRDLHFGTDTFKIGEHCEYDYKCDCCGNVKRKIKGQTYLGSYERWAESKKTFG